MMFENLFCVKRYLQNQTVKQVCCSRFTGKYTVHLVGETLMCCLLPNGYCEVSLIKKGCGDTQTVLLSNNGREMLQSFLDALLLQINVE